MLRNKNLSLDSQRLKYKLKISFYLMSILPLLVCIYLASNYILPDVGIRLDIVLSIVLSILISLFIAVIGYHLIKKVFDRILSVSTEAKLIAAGDINRVVEMVPSDEVGDLAGSLNQITQEIRSNMDELKNYGERTTQINLEIQKHVLTLSSLLQIGSLISQGADLDDIFKLALEKSKILANSDLAYLLYREQAQEEFYMKALEGVYSERILKIKIPLKESIFNKLIQTNKPLILDKENVLPEDLSTDFYKKFNLKNTAALPIFLRGRVRGILGIGNIQESFLYKKDDIGFLDILSKQLAIAIENDILIKQVKKLEVKDALTGLYNEAFIRSRLQEEIKRAIMHQRPCAFILLNIDNFQRFRSHVDPSQIGVYLKKVASSIKDSVTEIDPVARTAESEFAVVLPEKNKRKAQEIAKKLKKTIESSFSKERDTNKRLTVSVGVSENPVDGVEATELINKAKESIAR